MGLQGRTELRLILIRWHDEAYAMKLVHSVGQSSKFFHQPFGQIDNSVMSLLEASECRMGGTVTNDISKQLLPLVKAQDQQARTSSQQKLGLKPNYWKMWWKVGPGWWTYQSGTNGQLGKVIGIRLPFHNQPATSEITVE